MTPREHAEIVLQAIVGTIFFLLIMTALLLAGSS